MKPKYAKRPPMLVMRGLVNDKLETRERIAVEAIVGGWGTTEHYQTLADMQGVMLLAGTTDESRKWARDYAHDTIKALRTKITEMERQEPAGYGVRYVEPANGEEDWDSIWRHRVFAEDHIKDFTQAYVDIGEPVGAITVVPLYALPGAQNVPEKLCYDSRWKISIDYVDGWNAPIDAVRGKSPSWYCPDCCIVFPFGEPKSCPHDDARCNRALAAAPKVEGK